MALDVAGLRIVHYPAEALCAKAEPIGEIDATVRAVAARMLALMHEADGAGLAAPQVGLSWRMFVTRADEERPELVYINPRISELSDEPVVRDEGCLSLPGITLEIRRPEAATVTAVGLDGKEFSHRDDGLLARIWQHENVHLDGILIIDKMKRLDRLATRRLIKGLEAAARMVSG